MFLRRYLVALTVLFVVSQSFAQSPTPTPSPTPDPDADLKKAAVEFLRETSAEIGNLRTLENRISFASEMAGLMWFSDQREANAMYQTVVNDFKQLLAQYDGLSNSLPATENEREMYTSIAAGDDRAKILLKLTKIGGVRQQIAMSMAEHDPSLAYDFYFETSSMITNQNFRKMLTDRDRYFEAQLMRRIAEKDPEKALKFAIKSLENGVGWTHRDLLSEIYGRNDKGGAEFAAAIVSRLKSDKTSAANIGNVRSFLEMGAGNARMLKTKGGKTRMFTDSELEALATIIADQLLARTVTGDEDGPNGEIESYLGSIEPYAPAKAAAIRRKFNIKSEAVNDAPAVLKTAPIRRETPAPRITAPSTQEDELKRKEAETAKAMKELGNKDLPKEERLKIVEQVRETINGKGSKREKIIAISALAALVARAGDKELAADVMKDAASLVELNPRNYRQFMETWMLVAGYAEADPDKAFPLLDDTILRVNDTLGAFIKVAEFIDVTGEMIDEGELQVGMFGGSMISGLTREAGIATGTLKSLARADFDKLKSATNKFDRTEIRIMAKTMVLRSILGEIKPQTGLGSSEKADVDEPGDVEN